MTSTKVLLIVTIVYMVCADRCAADNENDDDIPILSQVKSLTLSRTNPTLRNHKILSLDLDARRKLCQAKISEVAKYFGALKQPQTNNYFVPAAQFYQVNISTQFLPAFRCPTFPSLYIVGVTDAVSDVYVVRMMNPYLDYKFEYEAAVNVEEIEPSKKKEKDKKDKEEKKQKKTKDEDEGEPSDKKKKDEDEGEKKEEKEDDEKKQKGEKGTGEGTEKDKKEVTDEKKPKDKTDKEETKKKDEDEDKKEQKGKKVHEEVEEEDEKEDADEKKSKDKKGKDKKKKTEDKLLEQHLFSKMINVDAKQRWYLCNMARKLIRYQVDDTTYAGDEEPKLYKFSYPVWPSETDVAFQCFVKPEIYIRVSRSNTENVFMITLVEPSSPGPELLKSLSFKF